MSRTSQLTSPQLIPSNILPDELWRCIGFKLPIADRLRFRAVCKTWASFVPSRMPPCLMLEQDKQEEVQDSKPPPRRFAGLGDQSTFQLDLPQLHRSRCVGSSGNWLITVHADSSLRLSNPFDHSQLHLPSVQCMVDTDIGEEFSLANVMLWKVILNFSPTDSHGCVAVAIHEFPKALAFTRLGDHRWTKVKVANTIDIADETVPFEIAGPILNMQVGGQSVSLCIADQVEDVVFYKQQFYAITNSGQLFVCHLGDGMVPPIAFDLCGPVQKFSLLRVNYLVEWLGELLMVQKSIGFVNNVNDGSAYRTAKFEIYKFDFLHRKWNNLSNLGEHSLFLGLNTSISFNTSKYSGLVKKNCIYFTDDFAVGSVILGNKFKNLTTPFGHDMGVFDLEDKCITPHFKGALTSTSFLETIGLLSPPVWIVPPENDSVFQDKHPK